MVAWWSTTPRIIPSSLPGPATCNTHPSRRHVPTPCIARHGIRLRCCTQLCTVGRATYPHEENCRYSSRQYYEMKCLTVVLFLSTWYCSATALSEPTKKTLKFAMKRRKTDRRRRRLGSAFKEFPTLWREDDGAYSTEIRIGGAKQQTFSAIVDTASSAIAVPCEQCTNCGSQHRRFVPSGSSTVKETGRLTHNVMVKEVATLGDY